MGKLGNEFSDTFGDINREVKLDTIIEDLQVKVGEMRNPPPLLPDYQ